ncbi:unnamed protein product [Peronospora destructor]|uniref:Ribosomal protein eL8/eL30/eS12/Gadd45 domain-containing protein n=1 Tax=Peronospora destructor TaxID=86335 RepID=A0AAV0VBI6_9STRA|nr:unnamed protein product [Peronospora destructor]
MKKTKTTPVAMQFMRPRGGQAARIKQQLQKHKTKKKVEIVRPWTTPQFEELSKEERDIVLDRLQKEVVDVPFTRSHVVQGVNQVAKAVVRRELRVVIFANNPESLVFGHLPLLCRLHQRMELLRAVKSRTTLVSVLLMRLRAATIVAKTRSKQLTEAELKNLVSITDFLISKASCRR